jgi:predicted SprT family Zn-dependent metalloprotease
MNEVEYCCECDEPINSDPIYDESVTGDEIGPLCRKCHKNLMDEGMIERDAPIKPFHG